MIAKITRGTRVGDIAAYLHGPGKANEHKYVDALGYTRSGGIVIGSNIGAQGETGPTFWAVEIRAAQRRREDITRPIWQCSLRNAAHDRILSDEEWAAAGQTFIESMGLEEHPWVMVRHGKDHVHIVVSRVNDEGDVWHGRNDRRQAQTACTKLEKMHGLEPAPRRKRAPKQTVAQERARYRRQVQEIRNTRAGIPPRPSAPPPVSKPAVPKKPAKPQSIAEKIREDDISRVQSLMGMVGGPKRSGKTSSGDQSYRDRQRRTRREQQPRHGRERD